MMKKLLVEVGEICDKEYARANEQYPAFASDHEGHDVLREEIDETGEALSTVFEVNTDMERAIRKNDAAAVRKMAMKIYDEALNTAAEAIQTAAMAQKLIKSQDLRKEKKWIPPCMLV